MVAGMSSGATAALVCNPIEIIKTRQQNFAPGGVRYTGPIHGLSTVYTAEGVAGLWRGTVVSMMRSAAVTGPHLTAYSATKELLVAEGWMADATPAHLVSSAFSALCGIVCNHPLDLVRNRLYTQPLNPDGTGVNYRGMVDCASKMLKHEGGRSFYKGFVAHYFRVGPHYVITFCVMEQLQAALRSARAL